MESSLQSQLKSWRQHLHQNAETGFEEVATSDYVASALKALGLDVQRGIGGTGLVANLTIGARRGAIALRADMDALNIAENAPGRTHAS
jgi:metal-dependent amidase/aminoacylase/carboxypeptidase family protein